jgi:DNA-binding NarL/FixJ family response regulator
LYEKRITRIVIADDSRLIRERLRSLLADSEGIEIVGEAGDGDEALALFRLHRPDVLALDIWMPGKNGVEVLEIVRRDDQSTVVIMLTNDASQQHRRRCLELGANYFLHKSIDFESLAGIINERVRRETHDES